jgi:hypothetical protein
LLEPSVHLLDRTDDGPGDRVTEDESQQDASKSEPDHDPARVGVRGIAGLHAGNHFGFGPVNELIHQPFEAFR